MISKIRVQRVALSPLARSQVAVSCQDPAGHTVRVQDVSEERARH